MNYSGIKYGDMLNGHGVRVSLFVSGCSHKCKGCFNRDTWDPKYGEEFTHKQENEIFEYFKKYHMLLSGLSLLGGDPTYHQNISTLVEFVKKFKKNFPEKDVWLWSGYTWEQIIKDKKKFELISLCDVLIDGRFNIDKKDLNLQWKGSSNQRVIDVKATILEKRIITYDK